MLDYLAIFKKLNEKKIRYVVAADRQQDKSDVRYLKKLKNEEK